MPILTNTILGKLIRDLKHEKEQIKRDAIINRAKEEGVSFLSAYRVAKALNCNPVTIKRYIKDKKIRGKKEGGIWIIPIADFEKAKHILEESRKHNNLENYFNANRPYPNAKIHVSTNRNKS